MPAESRTLRTIAQRFKGRLSSCAVFDVNVCTSRTVPGRPWELIPESDEPFFQQLRFSHRGRRFLLFANSFYVNGVLHGTFANGPLTINAKHKLMFGLELADTLSVDGVRYTVFTEDGKIFPNHAALLGRPELVSLVERSALQEGEGLFFGGGEMGFYLNQPDADRVISVIERMMDLAGKIEAVEETLNLEILPLQFLPLIPLIRKWAVEDDSDREELLETTSMAVLRSLVDDVSPHLNAIDSYLDSFGGGAPSAQAVALGRLAECAIEARQRL
jgi:hypothetical protein